ncbi:hypothetical protein ACFV2Q_35010 [Streptomyces sp. NPDC059650]|uniref:hypothetical protein n=1 Tax=Streptomyces sp. NPDC059650 TaxID=3346896 RepID=UPI003695B066
MVNDGVLTITPVSGGTTLRLGPAQDGSTHPLRPLDPADPLGARGARLLTAARTKAGCQGVAMLL